MRNIRNKHITRQMRYEFCPMVASEAMKLPSPPPPPAPLPIVMKGLGELYQFYQTAKRVKVSETANLAATHASKHCRISQLASFNSLQNFEQQYVRKRKEQSHDSRRLRQGHLYWLLILLNLTLTFELA